MNGAVPTDQTYQLHHGDCLEKMQLIADGAIAAIVTDPPYSSGSRQSTGARNTLSKNGSRSDEEWFLCDSMGADSYAWWMRLIALQGLRVTLTGGSAYVFTDWRQYSTLVAAWESTGWTLRNVVVWDKNRGGAMGRFWRNNHEWVCVFTKGKSNFPPRTGRFNVWTGSKPQGGEHPTQKPVALMSYLLEGVLPAGGTILDPFTGSGTTGVAALQSGFSFIGIERDKRYVASARDRMQRIVMDASDRDTCKLVA